MSSPVKVVLAEDDADDRIFFQNFLRDRKDLVILETVENGSELIEHFESIVDDMLPNLIILDQNMPKLTGIQTLSLLKKNKRYVHIPVLIYSTYANKALVESCLATGASLVLTKPSDKEGYNKMIDDFFAAAQ